jgi:hypothetical protein
LNSKRRSTKQDLVLNSIGQYFWSTAVTGIGTTDAVTPMFLTPMPIISNPSLSKRSRDIRNRGCLLLRCTRLATIFKGTIRDLLAEEIERMIEKLSNSVVRKKYRRNEVEFSG